MSSIAKILTVLNLILAAAFLGWAANTVQLNNEYKGKLEKEVADHNATKELLGKDKSKLAADLKTAEESVSRLRQQLGDEQAATQRAENDNKALQGRLDNMESGYQKIAGTLEGIQADAKTAHENELKAQAAAHDADTKATAAAEAQRAAEKKASDLEADLIQARDEIAGKEKSLAETEKLLKKTDTELKTVMAATGYDAKKLGKAMPAIDAKVLSVAMDIEPGLVSINCGTAAGVERGFTFEIYEGSTYKGQARVEYVYPEMCSAVMVRKVKGETIRVGDGATTRL